MPVHSAATLLASIDTSVMLGTAATLSALAYIKARAGGRKCTWERDWAGKMILIVAPPSPTVLSLIDYLLNLPRPPQILFLVPYPSPLPETLLTLLHTIRLTITNPLAQLHCEPLPRTPTGVREFAAKWGKVATGMAGEGGRRIDAIILGGGWEGKDPIDPSGIAAVNEDVKQERRWNIHEYHFHFFTSLLPSLIRQPPERSIRLIALTSPTYATALPTLLGKPARNDTTQISGAKSITTLLLLQQFQLVLDTLAAAALKKVKEVPNPDGLVKKRDEGVKSNIMAVSVIMPWARDEVVRSLFRVDEAWYRWLLWILLYPLLLFVTPSPRQAVQSIIFALQAPVRYGPLDLTAKPLPPPSSPNESMAKKGEKDEDPSDGDPRRAGVGGGDVVRNCAVVDMPPVLSDPTLAKVTYDSLEQAVEKGVKDDALREKAMAGS